MGSASELVRLAVRQMQDAVVILDEEQRVRVLNAAAERLLGTLEQQAVGTPFAQVVGSGLGVHCQATQLEQEGRATGTVMVLRPALDDARESARRLFVAESAASLVASLDYDTTLMRIARLAVPSFADWCAIDLADADGWIHRVAVVQADPSKEELARKLRRRYPPDARATLGVQQVIHSGKADIAVDITEEQLLAGARDPEHLALLRQVGLRSGIIAPLVVRGKVMGALSFFFAESGRRYDAVDLVTSQELAHTCALAIDAARTHQKAEEAIRARDDFLGVASQELSMPLSAARLQLGSALEMLQGDEAPSQEPLSKLRSVAAQLDKLELLINVLQDTTQISAGRLRMDLQPVDLKVVVRDVLARFTDELRASGSRVVVRGPEVVEGRWDRLRLEQVVFNLVSNAIKFGGGGDIEIALECSNERCALSVKDHGIGIPRELHERVFHKYEQLGPRPQGRGMGLGLYIVRAIVQAQGGSIRIDSEPGKGSTFTVELPVAGAPRRSLAEKLWPKEEASNAGER